MLSNFARIDLFLRRRSTTILPHIFAISGALKCISTHRAPQWAPALDISQILTATRAPGFLVRLVTLVIHQDDIFQAAHLQSLWPRSKFTSAAEHSPELRAGMNTLLLARQVSRISEFLASNYPGIFFRPLPTARDAAPCARSPGYSRVRQ